MVARRFGHSSISVVAVLISWTMVAGAQSPAPKSDPPLREILLAQWVDIGDKIIKLAEEFPEDKYEYRPVPDVRTFADQLRHVAFWNLFVEKTARGEAIDAAVNELSRDEYPTKAKVVDALKKT